MTSMIEKPHSRRDFLKGGGALIVAFSVPLGARSDARAGRDRRDRPGADRRDPDRLVGRRRRGRPRHGSIPARSSSAPGCRTAQMQIAADELDVAARQDRPDPVGHLVHARPGHDGRQPVGQDELRRRPPPGLRRGAEGPDRPGREEARRPGELARRRATAPSSASSDPSKKATYGELIGGQRFNLQIDRPGAAEEAVRAEDRRQVDPARRHRGQGPAKQEYIQNVKVPGDAPRPRRAAAGDQRDARQRRRVHEEDPGPRQGRGPEGLRRRRRPLRGRRDQGRES